MTINLLQLNINADNFWGKLIPYLTSHDFDILQLQELTGVETRTGNIHSQQDVYAELHKTLEKKYEGELSIAQYFSSSPYAYIGNAIFYKKKFNLISKKEIVLSTFGKPYPSEATSFEGVGRKLLHLTIEIGNKQLSCLTLHGAWAKTPTEEPHQTKQGAILIDYLQTVQKPFILSGDFNLDPNQPTIQKINTLARNLTSEYHLTNTLNPRTHHAKQLFPPGVAVDYIFTSKGVDVKKFAVVEDDISDHFGLTVEITI